MAQESLMLTYDDLVAIFPWDRYPEMRPNQERLFRIILHEKGRVSAEAPTGTGKTDVGLTLLRALERLMNQAHIGGYLFYITPTKAQVEQIHRDFAPDFAVAYGRGEHDCIYDGYVDKGLQLKANEIPCSFLVRSGKCQHYVDQETGQTRGEGAAPCPYYLQKYHAKQARKVLCTDAFYLFTVLFSKEFPLPFALVIDEAQRIAQVFRLCLSYEISDYHVFRSADILERVDEEAAENLRAFGRRMVAICARKPARPALLKDSEIRELMGLLQDLDRQELRNRVAQAIETGEIDVVEEVEIVRKLEILLRDILRYYNSLEYSLPTDRHQPLNYTYGSYRQELTEQQRRRYWININSYYVAPIVRKLLAPITLSYSATLGRDPSIFEWETGIEAPFYELPSDFPPENTRIFIPTDTPNLAMKARSRREPGRVMRTIARYCRLFGEHGLRSLVVTESNTERENFMLFCGEEQVDALSYGNGAKAKEVATRFKDGEGIALVGTFANYGEGIDLPRQTAPIIFSLRPGYGRPDDPATLFELKRFGGGRQGRGSARLWALWNWRVTIQLLQVRGRNIRSAEDLGVTFLISQQYRRFIGTALPIWLWSAYKGDLTFEEGVQETLGMFGKIA